ncbi:MAG TPA: RNA polymerase factor sigma-32 [Desulfomonilia bacterium]
MNLPVIRNNSSSELIRRFEMFPVISREEEYSLAKRLRDYNDVEAAQSLITSNLRNVVRIAMDYEGYGLPIEDIIQEGTIGLMIAVKKYDPDKGYRLMTYAVWWIKAMIHDYILKFFSHVRIGTTKLQKKLFYGLNKLTREEHLEGQNIDSRSQAISAKLSVDQKQIEDIISRLSSRDQSLDSPIATDSDTSFLDFLADTRSNPEDKFIEKETSENVKKHIETALSMLSEREKDIAVHRLMVDRPVTLDELGNKYNISRERVRQIENAVRIKLKDALKGNIEYMTI